MNAQPAAFDRDAAARMRPELWSERDSDPMHRVIVAKRGNLAVTDAGELWHVANAVPQGDRIYLGSIALEDRSHSLELRVIDDGTFRWAGLRELIGTVPEDVVEVVLTAMALVNWRSAHRFCPRCGGGLSEQQAGWGLVCVDCEHQVWPRTDPAIIVRVEDANDRVLLGSNAMWDRNRYSLLAGFVEPGESLEAAVLREIAEESGVVVEHPTYLTSQSWPFPASLMLGFSARATTLELTPDGEEILDLRWVDRDGIQSPDIRLPMRGSLARRLLEDWFGGIIPDQHD